MAESYRKERVMGMKTKKFAFFKKKCIIHRSFSKTNMNTSLEEILSKVSRSSAVMLGLLLLFSAISLGQMNSVKNQNQFFADVLLEEYNDLHFLQENIITKNITALSKHLRDTKGADTFIHDMESIKNIQQLRVEKMGPGIFVSFKGSMGSGDSLHPFYGYFTKKEIFWGAHSTIHILQEEETKDTNYIAFSFRNEGPFPLSSQDTWKNKSNNTYISLIEKENGIIHAGEKGMLVLQKGLPLVLENQDRFFLVDLQGLEETLIPTP